MLPGCAALAMLPTGDDISNFLIGPVKEGLFKLASVSCCFFSTEKCICLDVDVDDIVVGEKVERELSISAASVVAAVELRASAFSEFPPTSSCQDAPFFAAIKVVNRLPIFAWRKLPG